MKFHFKKSQFSVKSQFKEWKGADEGHSLNRNFTVIDFSREFEVTSDIKRLEHV